MAGRLTKCKLLGRNMTNAPESDVTDYLYQKAQKSPQTIIELYTSSDMHLKLLFIDATERFKIVKKNGMWTYGDTILGATEDAVIMFWKTPSNKRVLDMLKAEVYPEYLQGRPVQDDDVPRSELSMGPITEDEPETEETTVAPKVDTPGKKTTRK